MKKFLSFALALVMVVSLVPAFAQQVDAAEPHIIRIATPAIDGTITAAEWGTQSYDWANADTNKEFDAWFRYDSNYLYVAAIYVSPSFDWGANGTSGTRFQPRLDTDKDDNLWRQTEEDVDLGHVSFAENGTVACNVATTTVAGSCTYDDTTKLYTAKCEMAIPMTDEIRDTLYDTKKLPKIGLTIVEANNVEGNYTVSNAASLEKFSVTPNVPELTLDFAVPSTISIDGTINASEWGKADQTILNNAANIDHSQHGDYLPNSMEVFWRYDYNNLYMALRVNTDYFTACDPEVNLTNGSYMCPRIDPGDYNSPNGDEYLGVIAFDKDMNPILQSNETTKHMVAKATKNGKVIEFEMSLAWSQIKTGRPAANTEYGLRVDWVDYVNGRTRQSSTYTYPDADTTKNMDKYLVSGLQHSIGYEERSIVLDGTVNAAEWGTTDFRIDKNLTKNGQNYVDNSLFGDAEINEADIFWHYDDTTLYVGYIHDYGGEGSASYEVYNKSSYNAGESYGNCILSSEFKSVVHKLDAQLGNCTITIASDVAAQAEGKPISVGAATVIWKDHGGIAHYEIAVPLKAVVAEGESSFVGFVQVADKVHYEQYDIDPNVVPPANLNFTPADGGVRTLNVWIYARTAPYFAPHTASQYNGSPTGVFVFTKPVEDEDTYDPTIPSATPAPNPAGPGLQPGLTPVTPSPNPYPIPAPSTPITAASFTDVDEDDWYYEALEYVVDRGLMNGVGGGKFAPTSDLDRAMLVTTLWRLAGEPTVNVNTFDDVPYDAWYTSAVNWAAEDGIVKGYAGNFNPVDGITREQVTAILHRYADMMGYKSSSFSNRYYKTSDWAAEDVAWADANGILDIDTDMEDMTAIATRAEIAAMLANFCQTFVD